ncbi:unnamed protein product [Rhodiola kirilowii]
MAENLAAIDPFLLRQSFSENMMCWLNPADYNEKALYGNHDFSLLLQPDHNQSFSSSDLQQTTTHPPTPDPKRRIAAAGKSRITKRKSRATKKNQTTFITADPANFRQMVQQVTGIRLDTASSPLSHPETTLRPIAGRLLYNANCQLPTLDTSNSFLLEHNQQQISQSSSGALVDGETGYGASYHGFGIASFPTLESWKVM